MEEVEHEHAELVLPGHAIELSDGLPLMFRVEFRGWGGKEPRARLRLVFLEALEFPIQYPPLVRIEGVFELILDPPHLRPDISGEITTHPELKLVRDALCRSLYPPCPPEDMLRPSELLNRERAGPPPFRLF